MTLKHDHDKPDYTLLDKKFLEGLIGVMQFGADKYNRDSWRYGIHRERLLSAAARHLFSLIDGEELDSESGLSHVYHIAANMMMMMPHIEAPNPKQQLEEASSPSITAEELETLGIGENRHDRLWSVGYYPIIGTVNVDDKIKEEA